MYYLTMHALMLHDDDEILMNKIIRGLSKTNWNQTYSHVRVHADSDKQINHNITLL